MRELGAGQHPDLRGDLVLPEGPGSRWDLGPSFCDWFHLGGALSRGIPTRGIQGKRSSTENMYCGVLFAGSGWQGSTGKSIARSFRSVAANERPLRAGNPDDSW